MVDTLWDITTAITTGAIILSTAFIPCIADDNLDIDH